jgi:HEAT repeat protein
MIAADRSKYLKFLLTDPRHCGVNFLYTATDALLTLEAEVVKQEEPTIDREERTQKQTERLPVLEMLRKYGLGEQRKHLLLAGKPGSGKSTTLRRLCVELAEIALADESHPIPVFVQLKGNKPILELIADRLENADLDLEPKEIKQLLRQQKLVLLLDGVNEIPSEQLRRELQDFRENNLATPTIFTTRDLTVGGSLGIDKRLEMRPLTDKQMREFVHKYLPEYGDKLLGQLRDRLREIAETPLLLKMLCEVFEPATGRIPQNKAELFELFDRKYQRHKEGVAISADFRRFQSEILQYLAFTMLQGDAQKPTEAWLTLPRDRAEGMLEAWLKQRNETDPASKAKEWLEDLVEHHLLQMAADPQQIEFHHQLFQEYYAARHLRSMLQDNDPDLVDDDRLKHFYLNYLKWTEPLGLLLGLLDDEAQALRLVGLGLEVDWFLGARLAGDVNQGFQQQTVGLVNELIERENLSGWFKFELWLKTRSSAVIPDLLPLLQDANSNVRENAVKAIGQLGDESNLPDLLPLLQDANSGVRWSAVYAILGLGGASDPLARVASHTDYVRRRAIDALGQLGDKINLPDLSLILQDADSGVNLSPIGGIFPLGDKSTPDLLRLLQNANSIVRSSAVNAISQLGDKSNLPDLLCLLQDTNVVVRGTVVDAIGQLGDESNLPDLLPLLQDTEFYVRWKVVDAIVQLGDESNLPDLLPLLRDSKIGEIHQSILAIQARCEFYNYDIFRSLPIEIPSSPSASAIYIDRLGILNTGAVNLQNQIGIHQPEQSK